MFQIFISKVKGGVIQVISNIDGKTCENVLEIFWSKTKIKPIYKNGEISFDIFIEIDVGIAGLNESIDFMDEDIRKLLQEDAEQFIKKSIERIIYKAQNEFKSDIFGFASIIQREMPKKWEKIKHDWDEKFQNLDTNVFVKINITGSALKSKPIQIGETK